MRTRINVNYLSRILIDKHVTRCFSSVAVVQAFGLDDSQQRGFDQGPGLCCDLVQVSMQRCIVVIAAGAL